MDKVACNSSDPALMGDMPAVAVIGKPIFDPVHRTIRDARGRLLKSVTCPQLRRWHDLSAQPTEHARLCLSCEHAVVDTALMTSAELIRTVTDDPETCVRIHLDQENIEIRVTHVS